MKNDQKSDAGPKQVFRREAAILALEQMLALKAKGDRITAREIQDATGYEDWRSFRGRLHTWARARGFVLRAVPNDGYAISTDAEHADYAYSKQKTAHRTDKEALRAIVTADRTKLDDAQNRRVEFMLPRTAARVARSDQDLKDVKKEFRLTERVPLRALRDGE